MIDTEYLNNMAFARHVGFVFEKAENGESLVTLKAGPQHSNLQNRAHGGVLPAIVDAAGITAIWSKVPDAVVLTADLRVNFIGSGDLGDTLRAVGRVSHISGSSGFASVTVTNGRGDVIGLGQVTGIIRNRKPAA